MEINRENIINILINNIPSFEEVYNEHIKDNGELLYHVLFGELTRFLIKNYRLSIKDNKNSHYKLIVSKIVEIMELAICSEDKELTDLVFVSFLENLHQANENYNEIKSLLKPNLLKNLDIIEN